MKKIFQSPAFISRISTMEDKTIRLHIDCQEMNPESEATLFSIRHLPGWFLFAEQKLETEDIANLPDIHLEKNEKSKGQRLRAALYVLWQGTDRKKTSEEFYNEKMEDFITFIKKKLD